jgi:phosphoglucomutase
VDDLNLQGIRFVFQDGSRIIFRLSGTGSVGATVRLYVEQYESDAARIGQDAQSALGPLLKRALSYAQIQRFLGTETPTVIT